MAQPQRTVPADENGQFLPKTALTPAANGQTKENGWHTPPPGWFVSKGLELAPDCRAWNAARNRSANNAGGVRTRRG